MEDLEHSSPKTPTANKKDLKNHNYYCNFASSTTSLPFDQGRTLPPKIKAQREKVKAIAQSKKAEEHKNTQSTIATVSPTKPKFLNNNNACKQKGQQTADKPPPKSSCKVRPENSMEDANPKDNHCNTTPSNNAALKNQYSTLDDKLDDFEDCNDDVDDSQPVKPP